MQKSIGAASSKTTNASLLHKAIACILSIMLAVTYSSIAFALEESESSETTTTEDISTSVVLTDESTESEEATDTEESDEASTSVTESDEADESLLSLSIADTLAAISAGAEEAASVSTQTNAIQTLANTDGHFTISGGTEGTDWTFDNNVIAIKEAGTYTITGDGCDDHSGYQITVAGVTATITLNNVKITSSSGAAMDIDSTANVTLYLEGANSFASAAYYAGIQFAGASEGASLVITSTTNGSLTAKGGDFAAGIGGGNSQSGSNITISGGTVTATGGNRAAGIGGGWSASAANITISGGTITATGGGTTYGGAGIGGGYRGSASSIKITGGTVTATGGPSAAGIGGGENGSASNITISGGTVTATGGDYDGDFGGAGIGGGAGGSASSITISGGTVTTTAGSNAQAIGRGHNGTASNITVSYANGCYWRSSSSNLFTYSEDGSDVTTTGTYVQICPGDTVHFALEDESSQKYYIYVESNVIAIEESGTYTLTGDNCDDHSGYQVTVANDITVELTLDNVKITNDSTTPMSIDGTAKATLYLEGDNSFTSTATNYAGIQFEGTESGSLTITADEDPDGSLTAQGGTNAAGIGSGRLGSASNITISGGIVTAIGGDCGAGIGSGSNDSASGITISGGTVTAQGGDYGGAGIGGGYGGSASNITISGGTVIATGRYGGAGIGGGWRGSGSNITISGGIVTATAGSNAAGIGGGTNGDASNITISGGTVTATGGYLGAGIGGGYRGDASNITISGGIVTATAGSNAQAIGSGEDGSDATEISVNYEGGYWWRSSSGDDFTSSITSEISLPGDYTYVQIYPSLASSFDPSSLTVYIGDTPNLAGYFKSDYEFESYTWESDSDCVTVDESGTIEAVSAGSATVTVTAVATGEGVATASIEITVSKYNSTVSFVDGFSLDKDYDEAAVSISESDVETNGSSGEISFAWYASDGSGGWKPLTEAPTDAGSYKVVATLAGDDTYSSASAELAFTISKAASSIVITTTSLDKTYDGEAVSDPEVSTTGSGGDVTFTYYIKDGSDWEPLNSAPASVGTYKVVASVTEDTNYNAASAELEFTISGVVEDTNTSASSGSSTTSGGNTSATSASSTSASSDDSASASSDTLAKTGDTELPYLLVALIVGCLVSVAVALRKLRKLRSE